MSFAESQTPGPDVMSRRFAVSWRNRSRRVIAPVGVLDHDSSGYRFRYLDTAGTIEGFRPFIGFPDLDRVFESPRLWPFFNLRIMDRKRPDFPQYVQWLGLDADASELDILSRSGGEQKGDSVALTEAPLVRNDGQTEAVFLIRGVSYAVRAYDTEARATSLRQGDQLHLVDDVTNEVNKDALLLRGRDGAIFGWVPDLLIGYAKQVRAAGGSVVVLRNNGVNAPWHTRLLVRVSGRLTPGTKFFSGSPWPPGRPDRVGSVSVHSGAAGETERLRDQRPG